MTTPLAVEALQNTYLQEPFAADFQNHLRSSLAEKIATAIQQTRGAALVFDSTLYEFEYKGQPIEVMAMPWLVRATKEELFAEFRGYFGALMPRQAYISIEALDLEAGRRCYTEWWLWDGAALTQLGVVKDVALP